MTAAPYNHRYSTASSLMVLGALIAGDVAVTVLHVMSQISAGPGVDNPQLEADAEQLIHGHCTEGEPTGAECAETWPREGSRPTPRVRHGFVIDEDASTKPD